MRAGIISKLIKSEHGEILQALDLEFCKKLAFYDIKAEILNYFKPDFSRVDLLIISGGNDLKSIISNDINILRDEFESNCIKYAIENKIPIFGVCKGAQSLANFLGACFEKVSTHVGEHEIDLLGYRLKVNSYHNYAIKSIENAKILASSTDGYIEAFSNEKFKILGAMWHFEREAKPSQASKKIFEILKGLK